MKPTTKKVLRDAGFGCLVVAGALLVGSGLICLLLNGVFNVPA